MRLIGKAVHPSDIHPGDHVYTFRRSGVFFYTHHGIFVGNGMAVHLTRRPAGRPIPLPPPSYPSSEHEDRLPCKVCCAHPECGTGSSSGGVVLVCLNCFRRNGLTDRPVRVYTYGVQPWRLCFNIPGTSTAVSPTRSRDQVVQAARAHLSARDFGDYDLRRNNCEHFSTFCVASKRISEQVDHWVRVVAKLDWLAGLWFMWQSAVSPPSFLRTFSCRERPNGSPALAMAAAEAAREPMDADLVLNFLAASSEPRGELLVNPSSDSLGDSACSLNKAAS